MTVAPVLAQHGRRLPEPCHGVGRHGQGRIGPGEHAARAVQTRSSRCEHVGGAPSGVGEVAEQAVQGRDGTGLACRQRLIGRDQVPDGRQRPAHHLRGECVEGRRDRRGRHPPERSGPASEVAAPETAHPGGLECRPGLGSEIRHGMYGFKQRPHPPGDLASAHRGSRLRSVGYPGPTLSASLPMREGRPGKSGGCSGDPAGSFASRERFTAQ